MLQNNFIKLLIILISSMPFYSSYAENETVEINFTLPALDASPYHRPYVAVWIETGERKGVHTIAVWHEQEEWLRDMRQWWRKLGRSNPQAYDSVTGATRKPGDYQLLWNGKTNDGTSVPAGEYYLNLEAAREEGGRDFVRQKIVLGSDSTQAFNLEGEKELGKITIKVKKSL